MRFLSSQTVDLFKELVKTGVDKKAIPIFLKKACPMIIKIENLSQSVCNILKQIALTCNSDCAIHQKMISGRKKNGDAILFTTKRGIEKIIEKLSFQFESCQKLGENLKDFINNYNNQNFRLNFRNKTYDLKKEILVMGILNLTQDLNYAQKLEEDGADIIDVEVPLKEEARKIREVIKELKKKVKIPISINTYKSEIAKVALDEGVEIVNTFVFDKKMAEVVICYSAYCVLRHKKRIYRDVIKEIYDSLKERVLDLKNMGIEKDKIIISPEIYNLEVIRRLKEFRSLNLPLLVHIPQEELIAPFILVNGANILRVYNVKETKQVIKIFKDVNSI